MDQVGGPARARQEVGRVRSSWGTGGEVGVLAGFAKSWDGLPRRPTWVGKREVKGDPKDAGLSNRKDRVLCAETEETAGGQNSMAGTRTRH